MDTNTISSIFINILSNAIWVVLIYIVTKKDAQIKRIINTNSLVKIGFFIALLLPLLMLVWIFIRYELIDKIFLSMIVMQIITFIVNVALFLHYKITTTSK